MINFEKLLYFKAIADSENMTRASEKLFITQSTLSKALKSLEEDLGFLLFERAGKSLILTKEGTAILGRFNSVYAEMLNLKKERDCIINTIYEKKRSLVISTHSTYLFNLISSIDVRRFPVFNRIEIEKNSLNSIEKNCNQLIEDKCNLAIIQMTEENKPQHLKYFKEHGIQCEYFFEENIYLSASIENPITTKKVMSADELRQQLKAKFIMYCPENSCFRSWLENFLELNNLNIDFIHNVKKFYILKYESMRKYPYFIPSQFLSGPDFLDIMQNRIITRIEGNDVSRGVYILYALKNKDIAEICKTEIKKNFSKAFPYSYQKYRKRSER